VSQRFAEEREEYDRYRAEELTQVDPILRDRITETPADSQEPPETPAVKSREPLHSSSGNRRKVPATSAPLREKPVTGPHAIAAAISQRSTVQAAAYSTPKPPRMSQEQYATQELTKVFGKDKRYWEALELVYEDPTFIPIFLGVVGGGDTDLQIDFINRRLDKRQSNINTQD